METSLVHGLAILNASGQALVLVSRPLLSVPSSISVPARPHQLGWPLESASNGQLLARSFRSLLYQKAFLLTSFWPNISIF